MFPSLKPLLQPDIKGPQRSAGAALSCDLGYPRPCVSRSHHRFLEARGLFLVPVVPGGVAVLFPFLLDSPPFSARPSATRLPSSQLARSPRGHQDDAEQPGLRGASSLPFLFLSGPSPRWLPRPFLGTHRAREQGRDGTGGPRRMDTRENKQSKN